MKTYFLKFWLFGAFFLSTLACSFAQQIDPDFSPKLFEFPPSPTSAAFAEYGNFPVSLNTGTPNISIPLFSIQSKKLSIPITLSYHASGIKVSERSSWVGLGWSLNFGGVITRSVRGLPDESGGSRPGFLTSGPDIKQASSYVVEDDLDYLRLVAANWVDGWADQFQYNLPSGSGAFVYGNDLNAYTIPYTQLKITGGITVSGNAPYQIVDESGVIYLFEVTEETMSNGFGANDLTYTSAWYLTKMISSDHTDTITFEYESHDIPAYSMSTSAYYLHSNNSNSQVPDGANGLNMGVSGQISINHAQKIKRIKFTGGKLEFNTSPRADGDRKLDNIIYYAEDGFGTYNEIKRFDLSLDYFIGNRLKLAAVQEKYPEINLPAYTFEYFETYSLPSDKNSPNIDLWGYFNGSTNANRVPPHYGMGAGASTLYGSANRDIDVQRAKTYTLEKINYPTGGYTKFDFQGNTYGVNNLPVGGLRIARQWSFDPETGQEMEKSYTYSDGLLVAGFFENERLVHVKHGVYDQNYCAIHDYDIKTVNGDSYVTAPGSPVSYTKVTEYEGSLTENNGWIEYIFSNQPDPGYFGDPYPPLQNYNWRRGNLSRKTVKDAMGQSVLEVENSYETHDSLFIDVLGLGVYWTTETRGCVDALPGYYDDKALLINSHDYVQFQYLSKTEERQFNGGTYTSATEYLYDRVPDHIQLTKTKTLLSTPNDVSNNQTYDFYYPKDAALIPNITPLQTSALSAMVSKNMVNIPIVKVKNVGSASTEIQKKNFKVEDNIVKLSDYEWQGPGGTLATESEYVFNAKNNALQVNGRGENVSSVIWGYRDKLMVAKAENAEHEQIAFTSFESADFGNFLVSGGSTLSNLAVNLTHVYTTEQFELQTGQSFTVTFNVTSSIGPSPKVEFIPESGATISETLYGSSGSFSKTLSSGKWTVNFIDVGGNVSSASVQFTVEQLLRYPLVKSASAVTGKFSLDLQQHTQVEKSDSPIGLYYLTYYKKSGSVALTIIGGQEISTKIIRTNTSGWELVQKEVDITSSTNNIQITGDALMDDIRFHPTSSMMTTYTYLNNQRIESITDPNLQTQFYKYDQADRLFQIIDDKGNTLNQFTYRYKIILESNESIFSFGRTGGIEKVDITSNMNWAVTVPPGANYTVSPMSGVGNRTLTITSDINQTDQVLNSTFLVSTQDEDGEKIIEIDVNQNPTQLILTPGSLSVNESGSAVNFNITSNASWSITDNRIWLSTTPTSGVNNQTITVNATANTSPDTRSGSITVSTSPVLSKTITVTQAGASNYLTVSPSSVNISEPYVSSVVSVSASGTWSYTVNYVNGGYGWLNVTRSGNQLYISVPGAPSGSGPFDAVVAVTGGGITRNIFVSYSGGTIGY